MVPHFVHIIAGTVRSPGRWVPIDDEHTMVYSWTCGRDEYVPLSPESRSARQTVILRDAHDIRNTDALEADDSAISSRRRRRK